MLYYLNKIYHININNNKYFLKLLYYLFYDDIIYLICIF